jgi:L-threonylcarbamoyladenylate synthase
MIINDVTMIAQVEIDNAVRILRGGGLVALPTETVYGLAADARNPLALKKIFQVKERPIDHPLIVHIATIKQLAEWASAIPADAYALAEVFWPGPLTLILKKAPSVSDWVTGKQMTIGVRIPQHPVALALLSAFGDGLAAPSANRFGCISPTTSAAVRDELGTDVDLILDGGQCAVGVESTIIDVSGVQPVILRPGMITAAQIEAVLKKTLVTEKSSMVRVSGSHESHYAPRTPTRLIQTENIARFVAELKHADLPVAILHYQQTPILHAGVDWVSMPANAKDYAHDLYQKLRLIDHQNASQIVIEIVPAEREWDAIRDRLSRASLGEV